MPTYDHRLEKLIRFHRGGNDLSNPRWIATEKALGLSLPGNYKAVVDTFGASRWGDFLQVLSPFDEKRANLLGYGELILQADRETRNAFPSHYPIPLYPEAGGLLPWACTDNGDTLYFITSASPDDWPILIKDARSPEFEVSFLLPSTLIHHIATGSYRSAILPRLSGGRPDNA
jgi:hypothetical protein